MVEAHEAQSQRLRDPAWRPRHDFAPPSVDSFRADREREDDRRVVEALRKLVPADGTFVDVGAGAGRFSIPLARGVARVIAVEPSDAMRQVLERDTQRAGLSNVEIIGTRWESAVGVTGDVVLAAHVVYPLLDVAPFVQKLDAAARRWAAILVFADPPLSWLFGFWPRVHGEERLPPPHLPQVVEVVTEQGFGPPEVDLIEVEPFDLGPPDIARQKLRGRLYVAPDSPTDRKLADAMDELLEPREGVLVPRNNRPVTVGLVRWAPR
jgi:2-polyprenyl-3-methyl-5-hydroxy-6-metoxy-1,4-benzoquinol methylase